MTIEQSRPDRRVVTAALSHVRRNAVGYAALFVALGGTSYAAAKLPANSVGGRQIARDAVTSAKVKDASLRARDFMKGQLPAGAPGPAGAKGEAGARGETGPRGETGSRGASFDAAAPLAPGQTISGPFAAGGSAPPGGGPGIIGTALTFAPRLPTGCGDACATPIVRYVAAGSSSPFCPGAERAEAGYLCLYEADAFGNVSFTGIADPDGHGATTQSYGVALYWTVASGTAFVRGSWTYRAP